MKRIITFILNFTLLISLFSFSVQAKTETKLLAITFDDGPSRYTSELLDGLKLRGAKATFFMVGPNVSAYPDVVRRMKDEGHQLATHTMSHAYLPSLEPSEILEEVNGVEERIENIVGEGKHYLRPPYGAFNSKVKSTVGTPMIHWSLDTEDWRYRNSTAVYNSIVNTVKDGDIILLHDLYKTSVEGALKAIDTLQQRGYVFVTVEQLLRRRGITPEDGTVYFDAPNVGINLPAVIPPTIAVRNTPLGAKVVIGRYAPSDKLYFTDNGDEPTNECTEYVTSFYIDKEKSVSAIAVGESELSDISKQTVSPEQSMTKEQLDKSFYCYRSPFLTEKHNFVIGMKI